jgi:internalin A
MFRLMAFALAVSGLCLGSSARADDAEDKAATLVEKLGGKVTRDEKAPGKPVVTVRFNDPFGKTKVTDVDLKELAALKNLTTLNMSGPLGTDAGRQELQKALPKCKININR